MINRNYLVCDSCATKVMVRTAIGHGYKQEHSFDCPGCGVEIRYILDIDQENVSLSYREPHNAHWTSDDTGVVKVLTFDAELAVPRNLPPFISPFIATAFNISDLDKYRTEETFRWQWRENFWPITERLMVHWERGNDALFDQDLARLELPLDDATRLGRTKLLGKYIERCFSFFTLLPPPTRARIEQRIALASAIAPPVVAELSRTYVDSGRMATLWRQLKDVRRLFLKHYPVLLPLVRFRYWRSDLQDLSTVELSEKRFTDLRQLYVDSFETLCRLVVIAAGFEEIIAGRRLEIPTKKASMSLWDFEALSNGSKPGLLQRYPIADLFIGAIDHKLRNGIGHHAAHYAAQSDTVVYYESKEDATVERILPYTVFVEKVYSTFCALQLSSLYHQRLLELAEGRLQ